MLILTMQLFKILQAEKSIYLENEHKVIKTSQQFSNCIPCYLTLLGGHIKL